VELVGDSTRDGRWALVRLAVDGDRIVEADAEGLDRPLEGLTLLEAAAVGGDELTVDARANALGVGTARVQPQSQSYPDRVPSGAQQRHRAVDTATHRDRHAARHGCGPERGAERIRKGVHGQLVASDGGGLEKG